MTDPEWWQHLERLKDFAHDLLREIEALALKAKPFAPVTPPSTESGPAPEASKAPEVGDSCEWCGDAFTTEHPVHACRGRNGTRE